MTTLSIFQYFIIFLAMLGGALSGIYLGLYTILEPQVKPKTQRIVKKESPRDNLATQTIQPAAPASVSQKKNGDGDAIREKMKNQDAHYCFLNQQDHKPDSMTENEPETAAEE